MHLSFLALKFSYITTYFDEEFYKYRNLSTAQSIASVHGAVLALTASVLSVPYDMPRCVHVKHNRPYLQLLFFWTVTVNSINHGMIEQRFQ